MCYGDESNYGEDCAQVIQSARNKRPASAILHRHWVFERSSGFAGWRCTKCGTWVYDSKPFACKCNAVVK